MFDLFLQAFIATDITFAMKPYFRGQFCSVDVREGLLVAYLKHMLAVCNVRFLSHLNDFPRTDRYVLTFTLYVHSIMLRERIRARVWA